MELVDYNLLLYNIKLHKDILHVSIIRTRNPISKDNIKSSSEYNSILPSEINNEELRNNILNKVNELYDNVGSIKNNKDNPIISVSPYLHFVSKFYHPILKAYHKKKISYNPESYSRLETTYIFFIKQHTDKLYYYVSVKPSIEKIRIFESFIQHSNNIYYTRNLLSDRNLLKEIIYSPLNNDIVKINKLYSYLLNANVNPITFLNNNNFIHLLFIK